ncbi:DUF1826 domain-containing protein [Nostoc sp. 3335mG]|nr:DUF1826 domain-containing protein [Nostoc sp. 3335mG]
MLLIQEPKPAATATSFCTDPAWPAHAWLTMQARGLNAIHDDGVNLAIWRRSDAPSIAADDLETCDDVALTVAVPALATEIPAALAAAGYAERERGLLAQDIVALGSQFAALLDLDRVAVRLEVIETDACRRFHADYVAVRLISSYVGPGTQWLDNGDALAMAKGAEVAELTIRSIATGDVALFKGRDRTVAPIVHRSPPVAATGERRLVLVIDPARADPAGAGSV